MGRFVNIGMVTFNRLEFTKQAIAAVTKLTKFPFRLSVVDNGSEDGTPEYLLELKEKGVIHNLLLLQENMGIAKASNLAWQLEPQANYFLKLDNDIVIQKKGWLKEMIRALDKIPFLGVLGYNFEPVSYDVTKINKISIRLKQGNIGGACFLIPKRTERVLGYWCEDYGLYGEEDADYCERLRLTGFVHAYMEDEAIGIHLPAGKAASIDPDNLKASDGIEEHAFSDYRKFKDEKRKEAIQESGLFRKNIQDYFSFQKSFFVWPGKWEVSRESRFQMAIQNQKKLLKLKEESCPALAEETIILIAELFYMNGKISDGESWVKKAATLMMQKQEPTLFELYKLGSFEKALNHFKEAEKCFQGVLNQTQEKQLQVGAFFHLGEMYFHQSLDDKAFNYFEKCLRLNPEHKRANQYLTALASSKVVQ